MPTKIRLQRRGKKGQPFKTNYNANKNEIAEKR